MRFIAVLAALLYAVALFYVALRWRGGALPRAALVVAGLAILAVGSWRMMPQAMPLPDMGEDVRALYAQKRVLPQGPIPVYHLGHSLVGRDMPAMLAQLADHDYALQLGWGTALSEHFRGPDAINGYAQENATPRHRDPHDALASGDYRAFVMTEMVTLKDAILYKDAVAAAGKWAAEASAKSPETEIFLYETWHALDAGPDWLDRLPGDLDTMWSQLLWSASRAAKRPVWLIPAGQVMGRLVAEAEGSGGIGEMTSREDLFGRFPDGRLDPIHPNDLGFYLVALTHYAVIYGKSPVGLPFALKRADGTDAIAPSHELGRRMQEIVWDVVTSQPLTGL